jgi:PadR family transcriptional regulator
MGSDFDVSQLLKGCLDLAVLAVVSREDDYGYGIARRIWEAGLTDVREASIYGTLNRLFRAGLLSTRIEPSASGPHRKYYGLSAAGRIHLGDGKQAWKSTSTAINHLLAFSDNGET